MITEYVIWMSENVPVSVRLFALLGVVFVLGACVWMLFDLHAKRHVERMEPIPYNPPDKRLSGFAHPWNLRTSFYYKNRESQYIHWYPVSGDKATQYGVDHLGRVWRVMYDRGMFGLSEGWTAVVSKSFSMTVDDRRYAWYKTRRKAKDATVAVLMAE